MPFTYKTIPEGESEEEKSLRENWEMRVRADYEDTIKAALNAIQMSTDSDFRTAVSELEKILRSIGSNGAMPDFTHLSKELGDSLKTVFEYLDPTFNVESREDDVEYLQIIKERIEEKIKEFKSFSPAQKHKYVTDQKAVRDQASRHKEVMDEGESRRAQNASTMEAEWEAEREAFIQEQRMIEEQIQGGRRGQPAFFAPAGHQITAPATHASTNLTSHPYINTHINTGRLTIDQARALTPQELTNLKSGDVNGHITVGRLTIDQARALTPQELTNLNSRYVNGHITAGRLTIDQAKVITPQELINLNSTYVNDHITAGRLTIVQARALTPQELTNLKSIYVNGHINTGRLTIDQARALTPQELTNLISTYVNGHVNTGRLTIDQARALTPQELTNLNSTSVNGHITAGRLTVDRAKELNADQRARLNRGEDVGQVVPRAEGPRM